MHIHNKNDKLNNSCLSDGLKGGPYPLVDMASANKPEMEHIRFSTVSRFKGLEANAIILADVDKITDDSRQQIYVGCSRARAYLNVFIHTRWRGTIDRLTEEFREK